ncbi:MAG: tRNA (adenosine(37)-N6)-threonylcarbamoyltransferase complex ATPase subunit type 1 TsaE [Candidatus Neomarinimicrobiota bacterium]|nr:tRNA (adenosine(37)-N6)-threonylcarbamoyltransferase complex ATPase subunit type 1 TsaE [Candidatus Neomarinimicrobiota bacterium]RKY47860.1 MAG: tRNA (adenosine(37)-N6)-threonylcarbamoyltransferase complex ATPase subunit type 1 TsaE [Candidatus Neomarinimicrobiota bacterium]
MAEYKKTCRTFSADETKALGRKIARVLKPGDVIALYGDLAAGKTTLTRGLAEAFQANQPATSPTFTLINEYPGTLTLYHFDCYRIKDAREVLYLGFEEYLDMRGIVVVEWPQKIEKFLPEDTIRIRLVQSGSRDDVREITIESPEERHVNFGC